MKKFTTVLASAIIALSLAGCGEKEHVHTFDMDTWKTTADKHWHPATCEHNVTNSLGDHVDVNADEICDVCGYNMHVHKFATAWTTSDTNHWHVATCGHNLKDSDGVHVDANSDEKCDVCGYDMHVHKFADTWSNNSEKHWHAATCGHDVKSGEDYHIDENKDEKCDVCGYDLKDTHIHTFSADWTSNATNHWHMATCGHDVKGSEGAHVDANGDEICDVCEYKLPHVHKFASAWSSDANNHWHAATCGHAVTDGLESHIDANKDNICDVCNYNLPQVHVHTFAVEWSTSSTLHWHASTCGHDVKDSSGAHVDANTDYICDVCGYKLPEPAVKNIVGGTADEQKAILNACGGTIAALSGSTSLQKDSITELSYDNGDFIKLTTKSTKKISGRSYDVILKWTVDNPESPYFDEIAYCDEQHELLFVKFPEIGEAPGSLKLILSEVSCGDAKSVDTGRSYNLSIKAGTFIHEDKYIEDLNKVVGPVTLKDGSTLDAGYDLVKYDDAQPYFKTNNPDAAEKKYYYVNAIGKMIYNAPDGNWGLLADGDQIMEVYAGSALDILPSRYPQMKNGYVKVVGNMGQYQGNIQIGFVTMMLKASAADLKAEPTLNYQQITPAMVSSIKTTYGMKQCVKGANLSNSLSQITGKFVPGSIGLSEGQTEIGRGKRFTFKMDIGGETVTVAYDYHTDKEASWNVGLFDNIAELVNDNGASTFTVKGTLRYCGDDSSPFIQNDTHPGEWQLVPFLGEHIIKG